MSETVYQLLERGSGRTTRLIKALPNRSFLVMHSDKVARMTQHFCDSIGRQDIQVIHPETRNALMSRPSVAVGIDHILFEQRTLRNTPDFTEKLYHVKDVYMLDSCGLPIRVHGRDLFGEGLV